MRMNAKHIGASRTLHVMANLILDAQLRMPTACSVRPASRLQLLLEPADQHVLDEALHVAERDHAEVTEHEHRDDACRSSDRSPRSSASAHQGADHGLKDEGFEPPTFGL